LIIVIMGVAGAGKTTLGKALAEALNWPFVEGDDYHPPANKAKMARGEALVDADRAPWLTALSQRMAALDGQSTDAIVACSALKERYRARLAEGVSDVRFVFLSGRPEAIARRICERQGHFMPPTLLESQLAALEPPEGAIRVAIEDTTDEQVRSILRRITGGPCP
jgi:gluconokinase